MRSLLSQEKECYLCRTTQNIHKHHIYGGYGRRKTSDKYGCWVYLCADHHNMSKFGVHNDKKLDAELKRICQEKWETRYGSRADFVKTFGRNYI